MRILAGAFLFTAFATGAAANPGHRPAGMVAGKSTVAETMQQFGAPADTIMNEDGALTLYYPGDRLGDHGSRLVALHFTTNFVYKDARLVALRVVTVQDLASR